MKFREKSPTVEAIHWTGGNQSDVIDWLLASSGTARWHEARPEAGYPLSMEHIAIDVPGGTARVFPGEWIIRYDTGRYERCEADFFAEHYEAVEA